MRPDRGQGVVCRAFTMREIDLVRTMQFRPSSNQLYPYNTGINATTMSSIVSETHYFDSVIY